MPTYQEFMLKLIPARPAMIEEMTEHEEKAMSVHFLYLKELTRQGKVLLAGPVFGKAIFGLGILRVVNQEEAEEIAKSDPSVQAGVNTWELAPMRVSLVALNPLPTANG